MKYFIVILFLFIMGCSSEDSEMGSDKNLNSELKQQDEVSPDEKLNQEAFRKYSEKNYVEAAELYYKSLEVNPGNAKTLYNIACMHALINEFCNYDDVNSLDYLEKAVKLDSTYAEKALQEPDFKNVRNTYKFLKITNQIKSDDDILRFIKSKKEMKHCSSRGAYEICTFFSFHADGTYSILSEKPAFDAEPENKSDQKIERGTYRVQNGKLIFTDENKNSKALDPSDFFHPAEDRCSA